MPAAAVVEHQPVVALVPAGADGGDAVPYTLVVLALGCDPQRDRAAGGAGELGDGDGGAGREDRGGRDGKGYELLHGGPPALAWFLTVMTRCLLVWLTPSLEW